MLVRVAAVMDAVGLPAALLCWVWALPQHGGFVGATLAAVLVLWAVKRTRRAIFDLPNYRWFSRWLVRFGALGALVWVMRKLLLAA
jgi:hypothetical protein